MNPHFKKKVLEHLWGPTGSVLIHILVFFVAIKLVQFTVREETPEVEVMLMEPDAVDIEDLEDLKQEIEEFELPDVQMEVDVYVDAPVPEEITDFQSDDSNVDFDALDVVDNMNSPLVMKGLFSGRSAGGRAMMLNQYGGKYTKVTERSVNRALEWLRDHQNEDGSWGEPKNAMTGLALLTYLAHGETPGSKEYGTTVEKAIRYLVGAQDETGMWPKHNGYPHAICTYAISEAYGLTRIPELKDVMELAVQKVLEGQQDAGGWDYKYEQGSRRDTSVSGWNIQALKAAYLAGAENEGIKDAMAKAIDDLLSVQHPETGGFGYTGPSNNDLTMTGIGTLCLQLLGKGRLPSLSKSMNVLEGAKCNWKHPRPVHGTLYGWYYITQAMFHRGGNAWKSWNNEFAQTMTEAQHEDGHWDFPVSEDGILEHGAESGPVYSTTLSALMLQVYYRNLPTFQEKAVDEDMEVEDEDEIVIEVI